jgi:O-antigen/teichoic acid export membrane protein
MSQAVNLAKTSTKAGFNYQWGLVISVIVSSLGTIYVGNLLGDAQYGLYGIAFTVPSLFFVFRDWGINNAITRYTAQYRAENRETEIRSIIMAGLIFELAMGLLLTVLSFSLSGFIANNVFSTSEPAVLTTLIQIGSFSILAGGLVNVAAAVFTGTEKTTYNSIMLICQSVIKILLMIGLVITGFGVAGVTIGLIASFIIAGLVGLAFTIRLYRKLPKTISYKLEIKEYAKEMLKYCTPLSLSTIIGTFLAQFYAFMMPIFSSDSSLFGNYGMAQNFVVLISFFAIPITTMLFPAFSKLDIKKDKTTLKNVFQFSVKYSSLLVVPVATLVMCLSNQAVATLFRDSFLLTPRFLALLAINYLFTAMGSLSAGNIINSQGQTRLSLKLALLTAIIGFPMSYFLIMHYNVLGLIFTATVAPLPSLIISLIWIKKHYGLTVDWISSAKILTASAITAALTYLIVNFLPSVHPVILLTIGTICYVILLFGALILTKSLSISDLNNLREMTTGIGPITKIIHAILNAMEKTMTKFKLT